MRKIINYLKAMFTKKESSQNLPSEYPEKKVIGQVQMKGRVMQFKKQQLPGKIITQGKERFRIEEDNGKSNNKFTYKVRQL